MDENLKNTEQRFFSSLEGYEEMPGPHVWDAVDKQLDRENFKSVQKKYERLKRIAVLLCLLFIAFAVYEINISLHNKGLLQNSAVVQDIKHHSAGSSFSNLVTDAASPSADAQDNTIGSGVSAPKDEKKISSENDHLSASDITNITKRNLQFSAAPNPGNTAAAQTINEKGNKKRKRTSDASSHLQIKNAAADTDDAVAENTAANKDFEVPQNISVSEDPALLQTKNSNPGDTTPVNKTVSTVKALTDAKTTETVTKNFENTSKPKPAFSIMPFFSPDIAWYLLKDEADNNQNQNENDDADEIEGNEEHEFSFSYGVLLNYRLNKDWGIQTGITLSNINIAAKPQTIYAANDNGGSVKYRVNTSSGYGYILPSFSNNPAVGDSLFTSRTTHQLQYISVPLALTYRKGKGKFIFTGIAGVSANFLIKGRAETTIQKGMDDETETVEKMQGLRKIYFSGIAGAGAEYPITKKINFVFAPSLRFALQSINTGAAVKSYPMSLGFVTGIKISL